MPKKRKNKTSKKRAPPPAPQKALQYAKPSMLVGPLNDVTPIIEFLENFQELVNPQNKLPRRLISIKIPEPLLAAFRFKAERAGVPYQTMIKKLMQEWLSK
jgi:hypothetical protein